MRYVVTLGFFSEDAEQSGVMITLQNQGNLSLKQLSQDQSSNHQ